MRAAPRGPARGDFQQRDRRGAARTRTEVVGAWARTEKPVPTRKVLGGYSRKRNVPRGSGVAAVTGGSCGSACAVCGMAHLLCDGPRGTRKASPRGQFYWRWSRSLRLCAGTGRKLCFVMTAGPPLFCGWLLPCSLSLSKEPRPSTKIKPPPSPTRAARRHVGRRAHAAWFRARQGRDRRTGAAPRRLRSRSSPRGRGQFARPVLRCGSCRGRRRWRRQRPWL
jgi:hypothetical protein